jgi:serine O-acetyltransferase
MTPSGHLAVRLMVLAARANPVAARIARLALNLLFACDVGPGATIPSSLVLPHPFAIVIGRGVILGERVTLYQGVTLGQVRDRYPVVRSDVTIWPNSVVVGPCIIHAGAQVAPLSYVQEDVPPHGDTSPN